MGHQSKGQKKGKIMIRLLVVDDHELVRIGLRQVLAEYPSIDIVGEAGDGETAIRLNREVKPDVVLLDIHLPGLSGFEVTTRLKQMNPDLGIIILTVNEAAPYPGRLLDAGASAYLTKGCPATELVQAIGTVAKGGRHIGASVAQQIALAMLPGTGTSPFDGLSAREMEVMLMLVEGRKMADIAELMHLSPKTVATYKYRIFEKLDTHNDVDMTRMAMRYGVVAPC
jgi:two-component system invasion response regulator UvrY